MSMKDDIKRAASWIVFLALLAMFGCMGTIALAYFVNGI